MEHGQSASFARVKRAGCPQFCKCFVMHGGSWPDFMQPIRISKKEAARKGSLFPINVLHLQ